MLSRKEKKVMEVIFSHCDKKGACLMSLDNLAEEVNAKLKPKFNILKKEYELSLDQILELIKNIALDDYFEYLPTEKKGEQMYLFTLKEKGVAFERELVNERRALYRKIYLSVIGAIVAGIVGLLIGLLK